MKQTNFRPQIWAGIECTINRTDSGFRDQLLYSGHYDREGDLEAIAALGITTLRYPVLWEKHQPEINCPIDFSWAAKQLGTLNKLNIKPVVGLVHHGSGPAFTNLLDPDFPYLLAFYAKEVATKFPWVNMYTPVNEPLTTARFSGLYGHWFPHETNDASFVQMLLNQLKGVVLSMIEIRKVNPNALLVQTEDLGKTYSTPLLQYQADLENERRYLTYDILCGRFTTSHPLWESFIHLGISSEALQFFIDNPCPPDLLGANYYCTSERYLDEQADKYPESKRGGNSIHQYADVEAVRVDFEQPHGFDVLVEELWQRYNLPIAITEAHLHCSREEQMKWFIEIYESACKLKSAGIDLRAVTAWSILGAYGWNKLLTDNAMEYEKGIFDVSSGNRRPTAMARVLQQLAKDGTWESHVTHNVGWWKRSSRFLITHPQEQINHHGDARPILIIGKTGTLGQAFARVSEARALHYILVGRDEMDICKNDQIKKCIDTHNPWAIINATGYVRVDDAESHKSQCFQSNAAGPEKLAKICKEHDIRLVSFSSDLVFDGTKSTPYLESDPANPLNIYGHSKAASETILHSVLPESLIIRTSAFFGPWDKHNFIYGLLNALGNDQPFYASTSVVSPTYVPHLVDATLDLLIDEASGIWHLTNNTAVSWFDFARAAAAKAGLDPNLIIAKEVPLAAARPSYSALNSEKGQLMPPLHIALEAYFNETRVFA